MKVALVYDRVTKYGGAERVLQALHQIWPEAPLYSSVYNPATATWAKSFKVITSPLNHIGIIRNHHEWFAWLMPFAFQSFDFNEYDLVISVTSAEAKGIITGPNTTHICYLLTPTRYLWSHTHEYSQQLPKWVQPISSLFFSSLRKWDQKASQRPDHIVAISNTVKQRTLKYYRRKVDKVIYPPVFELPKIIKSQKKSKSEDFYLVVSRLVPYKHVDLAVLACNHLQVPLVIVGVGTEYEKIRKITGKNVRMVGKLTQPQLLRYYQRCKALIFPTEEDFGLVPIEAQAFGKPVIAYAKGGSLETVIDGHTGVLFKKQTVTSLVNAIKKLDKLSITSNTCRQNAHKFNWAQFKKNFAEYVEDTCQKHQK